VGAFVIQIRLNEVSNIQEVSLLNNGVIELSMHYADPIEEMIRNHEQNLLQAITTQFTYLFGGKDLPRAFEQIKDGIIIRPNFCKIPNVCLASGFPKQ
jgi:hypothetical protein